MTVKVLLERRGGDWVAFIWGRGSPILRPEPGNARPASAARWMTAAEALVELPTLLGSDVEVVRAGHYGRTRHPHPGGCEDCREARICNACGKPLDAGRCTNGRCSICHREHCWTGGEAGHGYGTVGGLP